MGFQGWNQRPEVRCSEPPQKVAGWTSRSLRGRGRVRGFPQAAGSPRSDPDWPWAGTQVGAG
jgi:hypothetical protein